MGGSPFLIGVVCCGVSGWRFSTGKSCCVGVQQMQQRKTLNNNDNLFSTKKPNSTNRRASLTTHYSKSPHTRRNKKLMEQTEGSVWSKHKNWYREALPAGFEYGPTLSCWWPCGGGWEHETGRLAARRANIHTPTSKGKTCSTREGEGERAQIPMHERQRYALSLCEWLWAERESRRSLSCCSAGDTRRIRAFDIGCVCAR